MVIIYLKILNKYRSKKYIYTLKVTTCHNLTLMTIDLRLCRTHFSAKSELSLFVLRLPTAKRRMLEPLAPIQEEGFRNRGQRNFERVLKTRFKKLKLVLYRNVSKRQQQRLTAYNHRVGRSCN